MSIRLREDELVAENQATDRLDLLLKKLPGLFMEALRQYLYRAGGWQPVIQVPGRFEYFAPLLFVRHRQEIIIGFSHVWQRLSETTPYVDIDLLTHFLAQWMSGALVHSDLLTHTSNLSIKDDADLNLDEDEEVRPELIIFATIRNLNASGQRTWNGLVRYLLSRDDPIDVILAPEILTSYNNKETLRFRREAFGFPGDDFSVISVCSGRSHTVLLTEGHNHLWGQGPTDYSAFGYEHADRRLFFHPVRHYYDRESDSIRLLTEMDDKICAIFTPRELNCTFFLTERGKLYAAGHDNAVMGLDGTGRDQRPAIREKFGFDQRGSSDYYVLFTRVFFADEKEPEPEIGFVVTSRYCTVLIAKDNRVFVTGMFSPIHLRRFTRLHITGVKDNLVVVDVSVTAYSNDFNRTSLYLTMSFVERTETGLRRESSGLPVTFRVHADPSVDDRLVLIAVPYTSDETPDFIVGGALDLLYDIGTDEWQHGRIYTVSRQSLLLYRLQTRSFYRMMDEGGDTTYQLDARGVLDIWPVQTRITRPYYLLVLVRVPGEATPMIKIYHTQRRDREGPIVELNETDVVGRLLPPANLGEPMQFACHICNQQSALCDTRRALSICSAQCSLFADRLKL